MGEQKPDAIAAKEDGRSSLKVLNDFAIELISITDKDALAWHVAREVVGALGFVDCVVYCTVPGEKLLRQVAAIGEKNPHGEEISNRLEIPYGSGITGHVAETAAPMIVDDLLNDNRYIPDLEPARSEICVPLLYSDVVLGVIDCEHPEPGHFNQMHLELLTTVAAMTSSKLELLRKDKVLRESERNYRAIVEDQTEMISRHALDGSRTFVNESYCRFHGKTRDELLGTSAYDGMLPDDLRRLKEIYKTLTPENPSGAFEISFPGPDGNTVWQLWTKRAVFDDDMNVVEYQAVGRDITENKRAEIDRLTALEAAKRANDAKSDFLAAMSHELRTPLNAILGFSDIIGKEHLGPIGTSKYIEYAEDIRTSGEYLLSLVNDLLDISSIEAGERSLNKEDISPSDVIAECVHLVQEKAEDSRITIQTNIVEALPTVHADKRALRQVILNLLTNALKFTSDDGRIDIFVSVVEDTMRFIVADTGIGIPADRLSELTNPFTRVEADAYTLVEGWGLGLAITKSLIDLHDGRLNIESEVGKGTTVEVVLPLRSSTDTDPRD